MCFPIMAIFFFFWAFLWYRSPCWDHQLYFLVGKLKGLPEFGVRSVLQHWFLCLVCLVAWSGCSGSSCGFSCLLALKQRYASSLLLMLLQHSSISPYIGEGSISAKNKFFNSENASLRAPCRAGCAMWARLLFLSSPCTTIQAPWLGCQTAVLHQPATLTSPLPSEKLWRAGSRGLLQQADEQFW